MPRGATIAATTAMADAAAVPTCRPQQPFALMLRDDRPRNGACWSLSYPHIMVGGEQPLALRLLNRRIEEHVNLQASEGGLACQPTLVSDQAVSVACRTENRDGYDCVVALTFVRQGAGFGVVEPPQTAIDACANEFKLAPREDIAVALTPDGLHCLLSDQDHDRIVERRVLHDHPYLAPPACAPPPTAAVPRCEQPAIVTTTHEMSATGVRGTTVVVYEQLDGTAVSTQSLNARIKELAAADLLKIQQHREQNFGSYDHDTGPGAGQCWFWFVHDGITSIRCEHGHQTGRVPSATVYYSNLRATGSTLEPLSLDALFVDAEAADRFIRQVGVDALHDRRAQDPEGVLSLNEPLEWGLELGGLRIDLPWMVGGSIWDRYGYVVAVYVVEPFLKHDAPIPRCWAPSRELPDTEWLREGKVASEEES